MYVFINVK